MAMVDPGAVVQMNVNAILFYGHWLCVFLVLRMGVRGVGV